jgi:hypothetical protein
MLEPDNKWMELTAPLAGRASNRGVVAAASGSPFGEHRRRSSSRCWTDRVERN